MWEEEIHSHLLKDLSVQKLTIGFPVSISNITEVSLVYEAASCPVSVFMKLTEVGRPTSKQKEELSGETSYFINIHPRENTQYFSYNSFKAAK